MVSELGHHYVGQQARGGMPLSITCAGTGAWVKFRLGNDDIINDEHGRNWISFEDYAIALVDELEKPAHERARFTIGY